MEESGVKEEEGSGGGGEEGGDVLDWPHGVRWITTWPRPAVLQVAEAPGAASLHCSSFSPSSSHTSALSA